MPGKRRLLFSSSSVFFFFFFLRPCTSPARNLRTRWNLDSNAACSFLGEASETADEENDGYHGGHRAGIPGVEPDQRTYSLLIQDVEGFDKGDGPAHPRAFVLEGRDGGVGVLAEQRSVFPGEAIFLWPRADFRQLLGIDRMREDTRRGAMNYRSKRARRAQRQIDGAPLPFFPLPYLVCAVIT